MCANAQPPTPFLCVLSRENRVIRGRFLSFRGVDEPNFPAGWITYHRVFVATGSNPSRFILTRVFSNSGKITKTQQDSSHAKPLGRYRYCQISHSGLVRENSHLPPHSCFAGPIVQGTMLFKLPIQCGSCKLDERPGRKNNLLVGP